MYTLRVIVPKLNIRNSPEIDKSFTNWIGDAHLGETILATEKIKDWYKDDLNRYYWSGGVIDEATCPTWMTDLRIPEIWHYAVGKGVGVAVVDTGIVAGIEDLPYDTDRHFLYNSTASIVDSYGHGTNCAGLIGARNAHGKYIGVAPGCNIYICKIAEASNFPNPEVDSRLYADAITWCANQPGIHIISVSWGSLIADNNIQKQIQQSIDYAVKDRNKIVVCAVGDANTFHDTRALYPAGCSNTLSTGAIPVEDKLYPFINSFMTTAVPGTGLQSYGIDFNSENLKGTSQANAIMAGIIALLIEKLNKNYSYSDIQKKLSGASKMTTFTIGDITQTMPVLDGNLLYNLFKP